MSIVHSVDKRRIFKLVEFPCWQVGQFSGVQWIVIAKLSRWQHLRKVCQGNRSEHKLVGFYCNGGNVIQTFQHTHPKYSECQRVWYFFFFRFWTHWRGWDTGWWPQVPSSLGSGNTIQSGFSLSSNLVPCILYHKKTEIQDNDQKRVLYCDVRAVVHSWDYHLRTLSKGFNMPTLFKRFKQIQKIPESFNISCQKGSEGWGQRVNL